MVAPLRELLSAEEATRSSATQSDERRRAGPGESALLLTKASGCLSIGRSFCPATSPTWLASAFEALALNVMNHELAFELRGWQKKISGCVNLIPNSAEMGVRASS